MVTPVFEVGTYPYHRFPVCLVCVPEVCPGSGTNDLTHGHKSSLSLFLLVSTALTICDGLFDQIIDADEPQEKSITSSISSSKNNSKNKINEKKRRTVALLTGLKNISEVGKVSYKPRNQYIATDFYQQVLSAGPKSKAPRTIKHMFRTHRTTDEWTRQASELVTACKTMTPAECKVLYAIFAPPDQSGDKIPEEYLYNSQVFETMSKSYRRHREALSNDGDDDIGSSGGGRSTATATTAAGSGHYRTASGSSSLAGTTNMVAVLPTVARAKLEEEKSEVDAPTPEELQDWGPEHDGGSVAPGSSIATMEETMAARNEMEDDDYRHEMEDDYTSEKEE